jgi:hypothetical protein
MYALNFLLLITFILIGISGIMLSRTLFPFQASPIWRPVHAISSALSIVLLAVHIGLHGKMILNVVKTKIKLPLVKVTAFAMLFLVFAAGVYGDVISKTQSPQDQRARGPQYETALGLFDRCISFLSGSPERSRDMMTGIRNGSPEQVRGQMAERGNGSPGQARGQMAERGNGSPDQLRGQMTERGNREGFAMERNGNGDRGRQQPFSLSNLLISVSNYIAFIFICSFLAFLVDNAIKKRTHNVVALNK